MAFTSFFCVRGRQRAAVFRLPLVHRLDDEHCPRGVRERVIGEGREVRVLLIDQRAHRRRQVEQPQIPRQVIEVCLDHLVLSEVEAKVAEEAVRVHDERRQLDRAMSDATSRNIAAGSCVAMTMVNELKKSGREDSTSEMSSATYEPLTCSLSSCSSFRSALGPWPAGPWESSRRKDCCRVGCYRGGSAVDNSEVSRCREASEFLSVSVPVADPLSRQMDASSIASSVLAPQSSCRS